MSALRTPSVAAAQQRLGNEETETPLLSVSNLSVTFAASHHGGRAVQAIHGIDFSVRPGQVLAVVGESGSGKSASLLGITGLLPPQTIVSGRADFDGQNLLTLSPHQLRNIRGKQIGFVFQDPGNSLRPHKTIGAQLSEALLLHSALRRPQRNQTVIELLGRVGINEPRRAATNYPYQFSGGMKQRAMIAMAIANRPKLIIADEPTTALDATVQAGILALLDELRRTDGTAIVLVNHDLAIVHAIADEVVVMKAGRIVERGPRDRVYQHPQHVYTRQLLAASALHTIDSEPTPHPRQSNGTTRSAEVVLNIENLTKSYRKTEGRIRRPVVTDINLHINRGEILALVGESGSGKSTIGKVAAGILYADSGTVEILNQAVPTAFSDAIPRLPRQQRQSVQMLFQNSASSLNPRRTVRASLLAPLIANKIPQSTAIERVAEVVDLTNIHPRLLDRYPAQLSGGQQQRVALARALTLKPSLIVADEPIAALDVTAQQEIISLIRQMAFEQDTAFLFITHDLGAARHLAHRVIVLSPDGIEDVGTPQQVFASPTSSYTKALIAAVPRVDSKAS